MEFNEKLQELRKSKGLTQEELAKKLYVSRTAISKWESGRGFPSIDSLKEISRFFSVTIDELICPQEIIAAAENDKRETVGKYTSLICGLLDVFTALLLFIPVFGNGADASSVPLFGLTETGMWIKAVYAAVICITVTAGICAQVFSRFDRPEQSRIVLIAVAVSSTVLSAVFILTRQPYAGIICFTILVIKGFLIINAKNDKSR